MSMISYLRRVCAGGRALADIKKTGVVKVATFDSNPPFGSVDAKTHDIVRYDDIPLALSAHRTKPSTKSYLNC